MESRIYIVTRTKRSNYWGDEVSIEKCFATKELAEKFIESLPKQGMYVYYDIEDYPLEQGVAQPN